MELLKVAVALDVAHGGVGRGRAAGRLRIAEGSCLRGPLLERLTVALEKRAGIGHQRRPAEGYFGVAEVGRAAIGLFDVRRQIIDAFEVRASGLPGLTERRVRLFAASETCSKGGRLVSGEQR